MDIGKIAQKDNMLEHIITTFKGGVPLIFYGCGKALYWAMRTFNSFGIKPVAICDSSSSKIGKIVLGMRVESIQEVLQKYKTAEIFISSPSFETEIREYLNQFIQNERIHCCACELHVQRDLGNYKKFLTENENDIYSIFNKLNNDEDKRVFENVICGWTTSDLSYFRKVVSHNQYLLDDLNFSENETIIDCGAFTGDTYLSINSKTKGRFNKYYAIEPDPDCFQALLETCVTNQEKVIAINKGVYEISGTIAFNNEANVFGGGAIEQNGNTFIEVIDIDSIVNEKITFIKMDIEGSELAALKGARRTISTYKPKLAICIYHKNQDIIEIPKYILALNPDYKISVRHYCIEGTETVVYAY